MATSEECQYKNEFYDFTCDEPTRDTGSKFCIFHDTNYLKDDNYEKHKEEVAKRFEDKLSEYSSNSRPLKFIGYCLPEISFKDEKFSEEIYFIKATFSGVANFGGAKFSELAYFYGAKFSERAYFTRSKFLSEAYFSGELNGKTLFNYTIFEESSKVTFDISNMSNVSFSSSDITRIRFSDKVTWGDDKFTIIEEKWLIEEVQQRKKNKLKNKPIEKRNNKSKSPSLELVLSVYRNLRENYEFSHFAHCRSMPTPDNLF